jgi:amidohydrolase
MRRLVMNYASSARREVTKEIDSSASRLMEMADMIHGYAEIGFEERKSSELLATELKQHGFEVEKPVAGLDTAFLATYRGKPGGPTIGLLCEYDIVAGLGHACGHNLIGVAGVGAGIALSKVLSQSGLSGTVKVFGCPCEEGFAQNAGGKIHMLNAGLFEGVDAALMVHPHPDRYSVWGKARARENLTVTFTGRRALRPEARYDVVNALDAAVLTVNGLNILHQRKSPEAVLTYIISEGGVNPNIDPVKAVVRVYCRSLDTGYFRELVEKAKNVARGAALMVGAEVEFKLHGPTYEPEIPNLTLTKLAHKNLLELGVEVEEPRQSAQLILSGTRAYSTDFGNVSQVIPTHTTYIKIGPRGEVVLHTTKAVEATRSKAGHEGMIIGAKTLAQTGFDLIADTRLVEEAKRELDSYRSQNYKHPYPTGSYPDYMA